MCARLFLSADNVLEAVKSSNLPIYRHLLSCDAYLRHPQAFRQWDERGNCFAPPLPAITAVHWKHVESYANGLKAEEGRARTAPWQCLRMSVSLSY